MAKKKLSDLTGQIVVLPNITPPVAYSPVFTITGGAMSGHTHQSSWSQDVYFMDLDISFTGGTTTGTITNFTIQLPLNPLTGTPYTIGGPVNSRHMGSAIDGFALVTNRFDGTIQGVQGDTVVTLSLDSGNAFAAAGAGRSLRATIRLPILEFLQTGYLAYGGGRARSDRDGVVAPRKGQVDLVVTGTGWTTTRAKGIYYQDQDGNHRLKFNIVGSVTAAVRTTFQAAITGVSFSITQACSGVTNIIGMSPGTYVAATNLLIWEHASSNMTAYFASGDVELTAKPSWA